VAWPYTVLDTTRLLKERKPFPLRQFSVDEKDIDEYKGRFMEDRVKKMWKVRR